MTTDPIQRARSFRQRQTDSEARLWHRLRNRNLGGWKFRRQVPVEGYYADFVCHKAGLIIEIDVSQHADARAAYDARRSAVLQAAGFRILRFWSDAIFENLDGVLTEIVAACDDGASGRAGQAEGEKAEAQAQSALTPPLSRERERED